MIQFLKVLVFFLIVSIVALLCFAVYSYIDNHRLDEGEVVAKWYEPAETRVMLMPMTTLMGKTTITTMIPYTVYDGEDYCVKVKGTYHNKDHTETWYVTEQKYNAINNGDWICIKDDCSHEDMTYRKVRK